MNELLDAVAKLLDCLETCEGTWYQREWRDFGISEEQERILVKAYEDRFGIEESDVHQG